MAIMKTLTLNGETYNLTPLVPVAKVTLTASGWMRDDSSGHYSQEVNLPGVTKYTKVDLQPTLAQIDSFYTLSMGFFAINWDGHVKVYAIGNKPTDDITIQVSLTEVDA